MKVNHSTLYGISGIVWFCIGCMLLNLGIQFTMHGFSNQEFMFQGYSSFFMILCQVSGSCENALCLLIATSLLLGVMKGRFILKKTAQRSFERISKLENPTHLKNLYSKANYLLIVFMMVLGGCLKLFGLSYDIRGFLDVAVGAALVQGSMAYFHLGYSVKKSTEPHL